MADWWQTASTASSNIPNIVYSQEPEKAVSVYDRLARCRESLSLCHDLLSTWEGTSPSGPVPSAPGEPSGPKSLGILASEVEGMADKLRERLNDIRNTVGGTL